MTIINNLYEYSIRQYYDSILGFKSQNIFKAYEAFVLNGSQDNEYSTELWRKYLNSLGYHNETVSIMRERWISDNPEESGAGLPPAQDWRVDTTAAYDSDADATLVSQLIGWKTTKARPSWSINVGQTRAVAVKLTGASSDAFLAYQIIGDASTTFNIAVAYSTNSTNGSDGTWTSISHTPLAPNTMYAGRRQLVPLPISGDYWVRTVVENTYSSSLTAEFIVCNDQGARNDMWIAIGASLEQFTRSRRIEDALIAANPGYDPIVLNWGYNGATANSIISKLNDAVTAYGNRVRYVYFGNLIGNDISDNRPISDDTPQFLADLQSKLQTIYQSFPGKWKFASGITYRAYSGVTPESPNDGSLPYNQQIVYPTIAANIPEGIDPTTGLPRIDFYSWGIYNVNHLTDTVHYVSAGYDAMAAEIARVCGPKVYTGTWVEPFTGQLLSRFETEKYWHLKQNLTPMVASMPVGAGKSSYEARLAAVTSLSPTRLKISHGATVPPAGWNTRTASAASPGTPLYTQDGWRSPYLFSISVGGQGLQSLGAQGAAPGSEFPDEVLMDFYYGNTSNTSIAVKFTGLPAQKCNVKTIGSRAGSGTRNQNMAIGGDSQVLNVLGNVSNFLTFSGVSPVAGEIELATTFAAGNGTAIYFNAHILEITDEAV